MAEAAVETPAARFFCHQCSQEVGGVLPDFLCPRCNSGFVEELAQPAPEPRSNNLFGAPESVSFLADYIMQAIGANPQASDARNVQPPSWNRAPRRQYRERPPQAHQPPRGSDARNTVTEGFLQNFIMHSLMDNYGVPQGHIPVVLNLHGNPGDYVWGRGGWNAIITQLINQLDGTGPPPLPREKIDEIPTVNITAEQVDKNLQCTVCMEDFKLGEPVRLLPCQHHFHENCIVPWLQLHGTCPICRKLLMSESGQSSFNFQSSNDSYNALNEPGPSGLSSRSTSDTQPTQSDPSSSGHSRNVHDSSNFDYSDEF